MRDNYPSIEGLLREEKPRAPVYCVYPQVYRETARHFVGGFPGRVLYAVKANDHPLVVRALNEGGVTHFDCASIQEIAHIRSIIPDATCYLMNPVRYEGDARRAQQEFGTRHFMIDHASGLAPLVGEIDVPSSVIFARMAVSHHSAMADLSTKFGAPPADIPAILAAIHESGAEAAMAFNVGTGVREYEAYVHSLELARGILAALPFPVRLLDIGGGFPHSYPGYAAPPLADYFTAVRNVRDQLPLSNGGELLAEPGRGLAAPGLSALTRVLLRKEDRLYLNDGMYGAFWELRFKGHLRFPARTYRGNTPLSGELRSFRLFGPTCDSSDEMPGAVELPAGIDVGDYIEFGSIGAYSVSGRTDFNGFGSEAIVTIEDETQFPPA